MDMKECLRCRRERDTGWETPEDGTKGLGRECCIRVFQANPNISLEGLCPCIFKVEGATPPSVVTEPGKNAKT